jgi:hypothetical protein
MMLAEEPFPKAAPEAEGSWIRCSVLHGLLAIFTAWRPWRDDDEKANVLLQGDGFGEKTVGAQGPDDLVSDLDGHADEGIVIPLQILPRSGAVQERVPENVGGRRGISSLDHLSRDASPTL